MVVAVRKVVLRYSVTPQRSNAARVRNMSRFNDGKLPGNLKHCFKESKDKANPEKRRFKLEYLLKVCVSVCLPLSLSPVLCFVTVFLAKFSQNGLRLVTRFELIQIFKEMITGCDVGFCV